jgi:hypothetical protein
VPVNLTISHDEKLVIAVADGEIDRADIDQYLSAVIAQGAMPYRKLFDATFAPMTLGVAELRALGQRVAEHAKHGSEVGPVAIVVGSELANEMALIFQSRAIADRPFRIFDDVIRAREWLDSLAPPKA